MDLSKRTNQVGRHEVPRPHTVYHSYVGSALIRHRMEIPFLFSFIIGWRNSCVIFVPYRTRACCTVLRPVRISQLVHFLEQPKPRNQRIALIVNSWFWLSLSLDGSSRCLFYVFCAASPYRIMTGFSLLLFPVSISVSSPCKRMILLVNSAV